MSNRIYFFLDELNITIKVMITKIQEETRKIPNVSLLLFMLATKNVMITMIAANSTK